METFTAWCEFVGAWLLVAGPIYQAALELKDEDIEREHFHDVQQKLPAPPHTSVWWWLFPPARIILARQRSNAYRRQFFAALSNEDAESFMSFLSKATGWLFVASGGFLLALAATHVLTQHMHWRLAVFWILVVALAAVSVLNTAVRLSRTERILTKHHS